MGILVAMIARALSAPTAEEEPNAANQKGTSDL